MTDGYPEGLDVKSASWPDGPKTGGPGDEMMFVPGGFLLGAPSIVMPYGDGPDGRMDEYYGAEQMTAHPILNSPVQSSAGGTVYFERRMGDQFETMLDLMGVNAATRSYVAFRFASPEPHVERYIEQMRIVSFAALTSLFDIDEKKMPEPQELSLKEAVRGFVDAQADKWNEPGRIYSSKIAGMMGGDGDWAKESLAFGFHVENAYWGVYRIWSRAWLVTK